MEDAEFYQQLLKEFFETIDPASSGIVKNHLGIIRYEMPNDCYIQQTKSLLVLRLECSSGFRKESLVS